MILEPIRAKSGRNDGAKHLCAGFSKCGAFERHIKLVREISDDISIATKEVKGAADTKSRSGMEG